jgi:hypothetical protein
MNVNKKMNKFPKVVTNPSNANPKTSIYCKVVTNPTPANRKMNAPARVKPKKY